ncbi:MAG: colicin E3/pyocin S6 family cytotoxin [Gemmataceae bacterium]|nr:colicin E3/pyocin S6 family cytotoxin [Gemmataceae bacterium]
MGDKGQIYEEDTQHGELEKYNKRGKHLGVVDPETGEIIKGPVKGRTTDV